MLYQITYEGAVDVTPGGMDGKEFAFGLSYVPVEKLGAADEKKHRTHHRVIVPISGSRLAPWKLAAPELVLVLFEFARRDIRERLVSSAPTEGNTIRAKMVSTATHSGECPFDPAKIPNPDGFVEEVEVQKRMGFHP
jgi:hypothetical protein